jgi:hypothetical protein
MNKAPERIWLEANDNFKEGIPPYPSWNDDEPDEYKKQTLDYIRADLVRAQIEAAVKRALDKAMMLDAKYFGGTGISHHIRALDPAQFIEGDKT